MGLLECLYKGQNLFYSIMSVHDLAIDVGLAKDSDEYDTFVSCVENILEFGTGYTRSAMDNIVEKCQQSELDIAKRVIRECRREKSSPLRSRRLKWWEEYVPKRERITRDIVIDRTPDRPKRRRSREAPREAPRETQKRPMSPMFEPRKRPMSPMFQRRDSKPKYERNFKYSRRNNKPKYERQKRPMSPMFQRQSSHERKPERYSNVPQWGPNVRDRSPPYRRSHKRRRY